MKKNSKIKALFSNKQFLMVFSLALSAILWLFVATTLSPDFTTVIRGVPVSIKTEGTSLEKLNLHIFNGEDRTIDITITGKRYIVSQITKEDFTVNIPLSTVTGPGTYNLNITPEYSGNLGEFSIVDYSDKAMMFYFDYKESKSFELETDISELNFAEGYTADLPVLSKTTVEISGPKSEIDKIDRAVAFVSGDGVGEIDKATTLNADILLLDKDGNEYTPQNLEISDTQVNVTVTVEATVTVPLTVDFANVPSYFADSPIEYKITPTELILSGNSDQLMAIEGISVGTINFNDITLKNNKFTFDLTLPEGLSNVSGISTCEVAIDLSEYKEATFDVELFKVVNAPENMDVEVLTTSLTDVKVLIPKNLNVSSGKNLFAEIDIQNKEYNKGKYNINATIKSSTINKMWASGVYKVSIEVK